MRWDRGKAVKSSGTEVARVALDLQTYLYGESHVAATMPRAAPPPRLDPDRWRRSCLTAEIRCGACDICRWEVEANRWHDWAPWREGMELRPLNVRPGFVHLDAAILAWFEWQLHGRTAPSATGPLLDLIQQGATFSGPRAPKTDTALLRRSDDIVHIELAIEGAFLDVDLPARECRPLLIVRTHGVLEKTPTVVEVAELANLPPATVRSVIKAGRRSIHVELSARGLIPMPSRTSGLWWDIDVRRRELVSRLDHG